MSLPELNADCGEFEIPPAGVRTSQEAVRGFFERSKGPGLDPEAATGARIAERLLEGRIRSRRGIYSPLQAEELLGAVRLATAASSTSFQAERFAGGR